MELLAQGAKRVNMSRHASQQYVWAIILIATFLTFFVNALILLLRISTIFKKLHLVKNY